jgi:hypothetical protein
MVRPTAFRYNIEAAESNKFQQDIEIPVVDGNALPLIEFDNMVTKLEGYGIRVIQLPSKPNTPDAVFPNNWFSVHKHDSNGCQLVIYPMLNPSRREEKQTDILLDILRNSGISVNEVKDFSHFEEGNLAMEGTGSFLLDRVSRTAFVSLSPRADLNIAKYICSELNYQLIPFHSYDSNNNLIYHTNVMMSIGHTFVVISDECITDQNEKDNVMKAINGLDKEIISITYDQVTKMCGNVLQLRDRDMKSLIVLSQTAYDAFSGSQRLQLEKHGTLIPVDITTIERIGGGSARCMMAEIFFSQEV